MSSNPYSCWVCKYVSWITVSAEVAGQGAGCPKCHASFRLLTKVDPSGLGPFLSAPRGNHIRVSAQDCDGAITLIGGHTFIDALEATNTPIGIELLDGATFEGHHMRQDVRPKAKGKKKRRKRTR